jgi:hypothetical protein
MTERVPSHAAGQSAIAPDGTDLTLIRWMLSLTPTERLRVLEDHVRAIEEVREANPGWNSAQS